MTQHQSTNAAIREGEPPYRLSAPTFDDVALFVCEKLGVVRSEINEYTSLQNDIGIYSDDMDHLMMEYSKKYDVDLADYLWYFHTGEDGFNIGAWFYPPPNAWVEEIPITIGMLHKFANAGRWGIVYPKHTLPRWRVDILISVLLLVVVLGVIVLSSR